MKLNKISLSDSLFSKVRQRVLALFYLHPDTDFHTNEIIRLTKLQTIGVREDQMNPIYKSIIALHYSSMAIIKLLIDFELWIN